MRGFFVFVFGLTVLSGCSTIWSVDEMKDMPDRGDLFDTVLHGEYVKLAQNAKDNSDWDNVLVFVQRGRWAASGESPNIEVFGARNFDGSLKEIMENAYRRLNSAFSHGARMKDPSAAALLQSSYECMSYYAEKGEKERFFNECRQRFEDGMKIFENAQNQGVDGIDIEQDNWYIKSDDIVLPKVGNTNKNILEMLEEKTSQSSAGSVFFDYDDICRESYYGSRDDEKKKKKTVIYYSFNDTQFDNAYSNTILDIADDYLLGKIKNITITGYADTRGSGDVNLIVSEKRAKNVAAFLEKHGVGVNDMNVRWFGEEGQAVSTVDENSEVANRRVEIECE